MTSASQIHPLYSQIARLLAWILYSRQASLAIFDQAIISLSSISLTVVIARAAGIDTLGTVGFILALNAFGGMPIAAMVSAPAMVLFESTKENSKRYRTLLVLGAGLMGLVLAILLSAVYLVYRERMGTEISWSELCVVALLFVIVPIQDTLRRSAFAQTHAWAGLRLSILRSLPPPIVLLGLSFAARPMSVLDIVLVIVIANAVSVATDLFFDTLQTPGREFSMEMLGRHWHVSRWLLLSSAFNSAYEQIFTLASGIVLGDRAVAAIRVSQQTFGVVIACMQTFENTVPRQLALAAEEKRDYRSLVNLLAAIVFVGVILCGILLWWWGDDLIRIVFAIDYRRYTNLLLYWAGAIACTGARSIYAMAFRAVQHARPIFIADSFSFLTAVLVVIPVLHCFGVVGSGIGMLVTNLVGLIVLVLSLQRRGESASWAFTGRGAGNST